MKNNVVLKSIFFILALVLVDMVVTNSPKLYLGKDNGVIIRILALIILSIIYLFLVYQKLSIKYFFSGIILGILCYILSAVLTNFVSIIIQGDSDWDTPLGLEMIIAGILVILFAYLSKYWSQSLNKFKNDK